MLICEIFAKIAYHGTSSKKEQNILDHGFDLSKTGEKSGVKDSGVSVTIDKSIALEHADWAVKKFGGTPIVLKIDLSNLKIMPGNEFSKLWTKIKNHTEALRIAKKKFDAVELFNIEGEEGLEEFEILIFDPKKVKINRSR